MDRQPLLAMGRHYPGKALRIRSRPNWQIALAWVGSVKVPVGLVDFSQYLLQAKTSRAKIIGLAIAGKEMISAMNQASEFSIVQDGRRLAGLLVFITDVHSLGLERAQGLLMTSAYYWDQNDKTRAWAERFFSKMKADEAFRPLNEGGCPLVPKG